MKKRFGNSKSKNSGRRKTRPCLMAYTLNNTQPVICTLVADQPYFYMEENSISEDDILGFDSYEDFEKDLVELKRKIDGYERIAKTYDHDPQRRFEEFQTETINIYEEKNDHELRSENDLYSIFFKSRMGEALFSFAKSNAIELVSSKQEFSARYDSEQNKIYFNPNMECSETILLLTRELRRHWQHKKGVMINPLIFHPDHAILVNRAQQADLALAMVRVSWELQIAKYEDVWNFVENSDMADLGKIFAKEAFLDFRSLNSGKASSAVFEGWFLSDRCRHEDKKLIQAMLADHQGYVFQESSSSRMVSIDLISALGEQPFGNNYLATKACAIIEDPIFTEVRDRSNANFLWFVKFERSFQEAEHVLQGEGFTAAEDGLSFQDPLIKGKKQHDSKQTIVQFMSKSRISGTDSVNDGRENVIHINFSKS